MADQAGGGASPRSLEDVHSSVPIPLAWWRRVLAFSGPALMVSVGYMDPGNWGTDLAAGSQFRYRLLWVLLMSNLMALLLQTLATRLGVVTGRDLAQACRERYPRGTVFGLWTLTEIAIAATDLAEVIGTIIGLKLLFGVPYLWGLAIAAADTFLLLALQRRGIRLMEMITLVLVATIGGSFVFEIILARPDWAQAVRGFVPGLDPSNYRESLYVAIGMLGATVMPHNLYLHSALVQTRAFSPDDAGKRLACKYNFFDSLIALNGAFFINAAILVLAAATFSHKVETLPEAHTLLRLVWGTSLASILFAVALLASGQSSTLTGTLAGQVVMEGFLSLRIRPWLRRLVTRGAAILPALLLLALAGNYTEADRREVGPAVLAPLAAASPLEAATLVAAGHDAWQTDPIDRRLLQLLVLSQVTLSFQLPFAIIPLVQLTGDRRRMGAFANGLLVRVLAWTCAAIVVSLNVVLIVLQMQQWAGDVSDAGYHPWWIYGTAGPLAIVIGLFLCRVAVYPYLRGDEPLPVPPPLPVPALQEVAYHRIGVGVELAGGDEAALEHAAALARRHGAPLVLIHVVEGPGADLFGPESADRESEKDRQDMARLVAYMHDRGLQAEGYLGFGTPATELVRLAEEQRLDLLVLGTHGHRFLADLALGHTVAPLLHRLRIPVLVIPAGGGSGDLHQPRLSSASSAQQPR